MEPHRPDYAGDDVRVDLADQIANAVYDDPDPRVWTVPVDPQQPTSGWNASCQVDEDSVEFYGTRAEAIAWSRRQPAVRRLLWVDHDYVDLEPDPDDAPAPPPPGPTVQVMGPDHDGRWVALWFHRGKLEQRWGTRDDVTAWALARPAERRRISVDGEGWRPLQP